MEEIKLKETKFKVKAKCLRFTWTKLSEIDISKTINEEKLIELVSLEMKCEIYKKCLDVVIKQWEDKETRYREKVKLFLMQTCKHKNLVFVDNNTDNSRSYKCYDCGKEIIK